jgi:hypothetical protein
VGYKKLRKVLTPAIEGVMRTDSDACDPLDPDMVALCAAYPFRSIVCSLMWLRIVRKDINWAVWHCTLHLHNYGPSMIDDCNRILRYLELNPDDALCWTGDGNPGVLNAEGDHDASISSVIDDRSSVIASMVIMCGAPVMVLIQKLKYKCLSSCEGEIKAMTTCYCQIRWLQQMCEEIERKINTPTPMKGDCKPAKDAAEAPGANRSKMVHVDTSAFMVQDGIREEEVVLEWVPTTECVADVMTKALGPTAFLKFKKIIMGGGSPREIKAFVAMARARLDSIVETALRSDEKYIMGLVARMRAVASS